MSEELEHVGFEKCCQVKKVRGEFLSLRIQSYPRFEGGTGVGARRVQVPSEKVRLDP